MSNHRCRWCGGMVSSWNHWMHRECRPTCGAYGCDRTTRARYCYECEDIHE